MTRNAMIILAAVRAALAIVIGAPASAAAQPCASISVDADAATLDRWPELAERVRAAFAERLDIDRCARVQLGLVGGSIDVEVSLPDGRAASRLARPEDVIPALEALLLVPNETQAQTQTPAQAASGPTVPASPSPRESKTRFEPHVVEVRRDGRGSDVEARPRTTAPGDRPSLLAAELSLGASLHHGDGQSSASVGASSFVEAASWLVGFSARLDRYDGSAVVDGGDAPTALEAGVLLGRRFRFGRFMFDATAGPALASRGSWSVMAASSASSGMTGAAARSSSSHNDFVPRCLVGGRLTLGARSIVRTFVGVEGELGEAGPVPPGAARGLPLWTLGATLGVTVGTL
jgi:hypothetical protein